MAGIVVMISRFCAGKVKSNESIHYAANETKSVCPIPNLPLKVYSVTSCSDSYKIFC